MVLRKKKKKKNLKPNFTFTYVLSVSTNSSITFRSFSASESWRLGVSRACEWLLATLPVGLDLRVSTGDLQNPVTCSAVWKRKSLICVFNPFLNYTILNWQQLWCYGPYSMRSCVRNLYLCLAISLCQVFQNMHTSGQWNHQTCAEINYNVFYTNAASVWGIPRFSAN